MRQGSLGREAQFHNEVSDGHLDQAYARHVEELHHRELLALGPEGGSIRLVGQRVLLLDEIGGVSAGMQVKLRAADQLLRCDWPGSVRKLAIGMERTVAREHILAVLELNDGNRVRTVDQHEITSATLYRRLRKYGR